MRTSLAQRSAFLKESALFQELPEEDLQALATRLHDYHLEGGKLLYAAGDRAENMYLLYGGSMQVDDPDPEAQPSYLESGDVFGERALLQGGARQLTIRAAADSHLLYLPQRDLMGLLHQHPEVREKLEHLSAGGELRREVDFDWLRDDEQVHYVTRKHSAHLWFRLARAIFVTILAVLSFILAIETPEQSTIWISAGSGLLLVAAGIVAWEILDWRNDYYLLTNLRVVWLEQELLRSSSRKEAPLESIQSVNVHTSLLGRWLGFGDVVVRTFTGTVAMPVVADPHNTKQLIEEYVARQRRQHREEQHETIRSKVRQSLGIEDATQEQPPVEPVVDPVSHYRPRFSLFRTRTVDPDGITYHKHWFVLFGSLLAPALFLVAVVIILGALNQGLPKDTANWLLAIAFILLPLGVMLYRMLDWQNDIYRVTAENLIDTEKRPLGSEVTKSAPLTNVLSLENRKVGLLGLILNFGVVRINVGDSSLEFVNVHDPAQVQQDIFLRMQALKQQQADEQAEEERQRMADWLRVYNEERGRQDEQLK